MTTPLMHRIERWENKLGQPATIVEAHKELSSTAFKTWIRLMVVVDPNAILGWEKIASVIRFKQRQTYHIINELRRKGYVGLELTRQDVGKPKVQLFLIRRAKLVGRDNFIKLSYFVYDKLPDLLPRNQLLPLTFACHKFIKRLNQPVEKELKYVCFNCSRKLFCRNLLETRTAEIFQCWETTKNLTGTQKEC